MHHSTTPTGGGPAAGRLTRFFALLAVAGLAGTAVCAAGWYLAAHRRIAAGDLAPSVRQRIVEELLEVSPEGVYEPALTAPAIGYTLRRGAEIEAWGDRFTANDLGYRSGPAAKAPGTFRIVFVGDSWTYGMGVSQAETFAERTAALAAEHAGLGREPGSAAQRFEAWTLALPGYNTFNQLAALAEYFDLLAPDAVVLCPTINDADSGHRVLPNGSLTRAGETDDAWGSPFPLLFQHRLVASYRFRLRWRQALAAVRETERRLAERRPDGGPVPLLLFFTGTWNEEVPPAWVAAAGLEAPLIVTPRRLTGPAWRNPPPVGHPNPAAHRLYGRMVYRGLAEIFGWPPLPASHDEDVAEGDQRQADTVPVLHRGGAPATSEAARRLELAATADVPERYEPAAAPAHQCVTRMDCSGGDFAAHAAVLVRRRAGSGRLIVTVRRLAELSSTYPLTLTVEVPSEAGGTRVESRVPADGEPLHRVTLPLPADVEPGEALDVTLSADRTGAIATPDGVISRSLAVVSIEQEAE